MPILLKTIFITVYIGISEMYSLRRSELSWVYRQSNQADKETSTVRDDNIENMKMWNLGMKKKSTFILSFYKN